MRCGSTLTDGTKKAKEYLQYYYRVALWLYLLTTVLLSGA